MGSIRLDETARDGRAKRNGGNVRDGRKTTMAGKHDDAAKEANSVETEQEARAARQPDKASESERREFDRPQAQNIARARARGIMQEPKAVADEIAASVAGDQHCAGAAPTQ